MKYLILALLLSSCSIFKKTVKTHDREQQKTEASAEEVKTVETKTEGKAKTVTTETTQGTIDLAGERLQGRSEDLKTDPIIITGKDFTTVVRDSSGVNVATTTIRPRKMQTKTEKKTEREESLQQTKTEKSDSTGEFKQKLKSETETSDKEVKKTGLLIPWYWWVILALILAGLAYWKFWRK